MFAPRDPAAAGSGELRLVFVKERVEHRLGPADNVAERATERCHF
jgi:hypothetical protein